MHHPVFGFNFYEQIDCPHGFESKPDLRECVAIGNQFTNV